MSSRLQTRFADASTANRVNGFANNSNHFLCFTFAPWFWFNFTQFHYEYENHTHRNYAFPDANPSLHSLRLSIVPKSRCANVVAIGLSLKLYSVFNPFAVLAPVNCICTLRTIRDAIAFCDSGCFSYRKWCDEKRLFLHFNWL